MEQYTISATETHWLLFFAAAYFGNLVYVVYRFFDARQRDNRREMREHIAAMSALISIPVTATLGLAVKALIVYVFAG